MRSVNRASLWGSKSRFRPVACADGPPGDRGMIASRVIAAALPDLRPAGRLDGAARPLHRLEGRRTARAAPRGRRPAADEHPAAAGLGRPGDPGRVDPTAADDREEPPARHPGDDLAL